MGSEKEKMDRLVDLLRFIDLLVRQMCRRAHYDHLTRTKASKEDKDSIYSIDHLKKVYDKPRESIYHLIKVSNGSIFPITKSIKELGNYLDDQAFAYAVSNLLIS